MEQALPLENQWDLLVVGAGGTVRAPFKRHRHRPRLSRGQGCHRALGERAVATLKTWKVLTKLRCRLCRTTPKEDGEGQGCRFR